jgi:hypothetical protein
MPCESKLVIIVDISKDSGFFIIAERINIGENVRKEK